MRRRQPPHLRDLCGARDRASTWYEVDSGLGVTVNASSGRQVVLGGNMDLWTAAAGYNQDLGIFQGTDCTNVASLLAWKASGGFAGTYSPNAAFASEVSPDHDRSDHLHALLEGQQGGVGGHP